MNKTLAVAVAAALLTASLHLGAQQPGQGTRTESRAASPRNLFTQQERDQFREKLRAAKTREERAGVHREMRGAMEQRAREKGITLPQRRDGAHGPRGGSHRQQMLTPEERNAFRERMRSAKTPEERATARKEMRSTMQQRAKEKGLTQPGSRHGHHGGGRDRNRPQLLTPEERLQYRDKMRGAKTPEERTELRKQLRTLSEQRAKEKGVTLREWRGGREAPKAPAPASKP